MMKKGLSILIALAMVALLVPVAISADGTIITVGPSETYTTIKSAITASSAGDTIQLVADITETNVAINKAVTIDTNGYTWTGGTSSKARCCTITSTVTIKNSQRTTQITADAELDMVANSEKDEGGVIVLDSGGNLTLQNIAISSTNRYTNNVPSPIRIIHDDTSLTLDNCYLTGTNNDSVSLAVKYGIKATVSATNTIFGAKGASLVFLGTISASQSNLDFTNCTFSKPIGASGVSNDPSPTKGTSVSLANVSMTFNGCTGTTLFGTDLNAEFTGTNAFTDVRAGVVVSAGEGTALYSDSTYETPVTLGALAADTPIYTTAGTPVTPTEPVDELAVDVEMVSGASIRLNNVTGIRFYTNVDTDKIAALIAGGATVEMGTLIAPTNLIGENELDFNLNSDYYLDIPYTYDSYYQEGSFEGIVGSIVNIKETTVANPTSGNITRDFVGRGYVKVTYNDETVISYADYASGNIDNNTRSLAQVSFMLKNDPNQTALYNAHKADVDRWASFYQA